MVDELIELINSSAYFPIKDKTDLGRIERMFKNANVVITAWENEKLVGLSKAISDFSYCCHLSDVCVRDDYKKQGIGNLTAAVPITECGMRNMAWVGRDDSFAGPGWPSRKGQVVAIIPHSAFLTTPPPPKKYSQ